MKQALALVLFCAVAVGFGAAQSGTDTPKKTRKAKASATSSATAEELREIKDSLQMQQQQIQSLQQQLQNRDQQIQQLQQRLDQNQAAAQQAQSTAQSAQESSSKLQSDVSDLKANATSVATSFQEEQKKVREATESPLAIHFKGITLTPGGFLAAETAWRQHGMGADVNTPFNSIPFAGAGNGHTAELFGSGRQSRISLLAQGKLSNTNLTGYYELDWLSAGATSNNNQSNSYTNRQRQIWGQAAMANGWTFTGGQMWSLVTETRHGLDNRTEALPSTIDAQYHVGFSWTRQYGVRVTKNIGDKVWLGAALENSQILLTAHNQNNNFFIGQAGNSGGLYNAFNGNYSYNAAPDIVFKAAFEPGFGHYEVFGLVSDFRARVYPGVVALPVAPPASTAPCGAALTACNDARWGGGIGVNARWMAFQKKVEFGIHFLGGDGVGRYGTSTLPDVTVRPDGTLAPIHAYMGLATLEFHPKKFDVYLNVGSEYAQKTFYVDPVSGKEVGYGMPLNANNSGCLTETNPGAGGFAPGAPANCTADTRNLWEGTIGYWYRLYQGPKGKVQFGMQYSYVNKNIWAADTGGNPNAFNNMFFTSFRYYLP